MRSMRRAVLAVAAAGAMVGTAAADDVNVGIVLGYTGPIESLTPDMAASAELALQEASDSGAFLGGRMLKPVRGDSTCIDAAAATAAAERLVNSDSVAAIMGADCSGVTTAVANNVAVPNGVVLISPSATSPALTTIKDKGYFFRTAPSDARQGEVLAQVLMNRKVMNVAVTFTNNDYGKGLSDSFKTAFEAMGGKVSAVVPHEDGKADYSAEVATLAASGADHLAVFGYVDQGGKGIIRNAVDTGAFGKFILADGMIGEALTMAIGEDLEGAFGTVPGSDSAEARNFVAYAKGKGLKGECPFCGESYDAAALIVLAMQAADSADRMAIRDKVMSVANAPGEKIGPGELAKGLKILADGGEIDYVGASNVELTDVGEASGTYKEIEVRGGKFETVAVH